MTAVQLPGELGISVACPPDWSWFDLVGAPLEDQASEQLSAQLGSGVPDPSVVQLLATNLAELRSKGAVAAASYAGAVGVSGAVEPPRFLMATLVLSIAEPLGASAAEMAAAWQSQTHEEGSKEISEVDLPCGRALRVCYEKRLAVESEQDGRSLVLRNVQYLVPLAAVTIDLSFAAPSSDENRIFDVIFHLIAKTMTQVREPASA